MTRKHFEAIAEIFRTYSDIDAGEEGEAMRLVLAKEMASLCKRHNANFDRDRFLTACNVK